MTDLEWRDEARHRASPLGAKYQTHPPVYTGRESNPDEIERLQGHDHRQYADALAAGLGSLTNSMREYSIRQAKKGLAFDLLAIAVDSWTRAAYVSPEMREEALNKIAERLAELRADLQVVDSLAVRP